MMDLCKIDGLVAEKIMDYQRMDDPEGWGDVLVGPDGVLDEYPHYSSDIAAAWEVVEKLEQQYSCFGFQLHNWDGQWTCEMWNGDPNGPHKTSDYFERVSLEASTVPLAICLAALQAVGVKEEREGS